jgi:hypothetical protein
MSYQPETFINFDTIQPKENIKNGFAVSLHSFRDFLRRRKFLACIRVSLFSAV